MRCLTASFLLNRLARETNLSLHVGAASSVMREEAGAAKAFVVDGKSVDFIVKIASFCGQGKFRDEECGSIQPKVCDVGTFRKPLKLDH
jgi:hypothetical protein